MIHYNQKIFSRLLVLVVMISLTACSSDIELFKLPGTWYVYEVETSIRTYEDEELYDVLVNNYQMDETEASTRLVYLAYQLTDTIEGSITFNEDDTYTSLLSYEPLASEGTYSIGDEYGLTFQPGNIETDIMFLDSYEFILSLKKFEGWVDIEGDGTNETKVIYGIQLTFHH
ncbi:MAG TPA: hypothetical protein PK766_13350 [Bacteroidales bacterium]|nr:hypothetical protein [Bacteroidales bacterium]